MHRYASIDGARPPRTGLLLAALALAAIGAVVSRGGERVLATGASPSLSTGGERTVVADLAACWNYDDDAIFSTSNQDCGAEDAGAYCDGTTDDTVAVSEWSSALRKLCRSSCAGGDETWSMLCVWEAVSSLPQACAGNFSSSAAVASADRDAQDGAVGTGSSDTDDPRAVAPAPLGSDVRLWSCDEHAFCLGCRYGDARYCEAVAAFYGGPGQPYRYNGTVVGRWTSHNRTYTGAGAAFNAINDDWSFWCAPETLADIERGAFNATATYLNFTRPADGAGGVTPTPPARAVDAGDVPPRHGMGNGSNWTAQALAATAAGAADAADAAAAGRGQVWNSRNRSGVGSDVDDADPADVDPSTGHGGAAQALARRPAGLASLAYRVDDAFDDTFDDDAAAHVGDAGVSTSGPPPNATTTKAAASRLSEAAWSPPMPTASVKPTRPGTTPAPSLSAAPTVFPSYAPTPLPSALPTLSVMPTPMPSVPPPTPRPTSNTPVPSIVPFAQPGRARRS